MAQDCKLRDWSQQDRQAGRTIAFGLWNGKISIQVYNNQDMKNKLFRRNFDECEILLIEKLINKIMAGSPESKQSIQFQKYDFQSKQFKMEAVFEFGKDSKQVYHLTVTDCAKQQSFTFVIKARATMTMGSEPLNDANLSALKVEALKDCEVIFLPIYYTEASLILQQADSMGYAPLFFGVDGMDGILTLDGFDKSKKYTVAELEEILASEDKLKSVMKEELRRVKKEYATPRKSEIVYNDTVAEYVEEAEKIDDYHVTLFLSNEGYFKKINDQSLRMNSEQKFKEALPQGVGNVEKTEEGIRRANLTDEQIKAEIQTK